MNEFFYLFWNDANWFVGTLFTLVMIAFIIVFFIAVASDGGDDEWK